MYIILLNGMLAENATMYLKKHQHYCYSRMESPGSPLCCKQEANRPLLPTLLLEWRRFYKLSLPTTSHVAYFHHLNI